MKDDKSAQSIPPEMLSAVTVEMGALDVKIVKLKRAKRTRITIAVLGGFLVIFWSFTYLSASVTTAHEPSSVSFLGPIFLLPLLLLGIPLLVLGIIGYFLVRNNLAKAENSLSLLKRTISLER